MRYLQEWSYQVAISAMLPTLYDIMIGNRFKTWYKINPEQAGFRERQGCIIQLFGIYLTIELAKSFNKDIFIGFIDYEKAFDYTNRPDIVKDLMVKKAGSIFTKAIVNMYHITLYVPKVTDAKTGEPILAKHGVTQGCKSSTRLFSFAIRDIPKTVNLPDSFLRGYNVFQLTDDDSFVTTSFEDLPNAFEQLIDASDLKLMVTNGN